ncbi:hypothetical protein HU200_053172 [Digitaria exilis]|uniref:Nucleoside phosphorylase domain-containing protein n=1 Tax=Digitaria exilis TaxID=1010633 RepID=A0A835AML0_9POAL|nr:hypothetical protein HU200_053172 [Digitaria exilis]CAB3459797.1 unnamed protein product [Digitaria exilis]
MSGTRRPFLGVSPVLLLLFLAASCAVVVFGAGVPESTARSIRRVNRRHGPFLGVVVSNAFEMEPLLRSPRFSPAKGNQLPPYLDVAGRRFRFGTIGEQKVIIVMTGLAMLLLTLFDIKGIVHFGIAGNADPSRQIGDVAVPRYWAHTGLWNWQRYGDGPNDELAFESNGDYTRSLGNLNFSDYTTTTNASGNNNNLLNAVWYEPEEVFPSNSGTPELRRHAFWVPVDARHYDLVARELEGHVILESCVVVAGNGNGTAATTTTCLPRRPVVATVERGCSASVFVDNAAYRGFLRNRFGVTAVDMETAAVALVSMQQGTPFIAVRALSDLAGGGSAGSNEAGVFAPLAAENAVTVVVELISLLN